MVAGFLILALQFVVGCGQQSKAGNPPIEFSFRKSQVPTRGMVAGVRNASSAETLTNFVVEVRGQDEKGARSHRVARSLDPQDSLTVGWVELDGWTLKSGDTLVVRCDQYAGDATVVVPER